jgi:hypothetical protein
MSEAEPHPHTDVPPKEGRNDSPSELRGRLGIIHLMVWVTVVAIIFALFRFRAESLDFNRLFSDARTNGVLFVIGLAAIWVAALVTGCFELARRRIRFKTTFRAWQAGHWLVVIYVVAYSALFVLQVVVALSMYVLNGSMIPIMIVGTASGFIPKAALLILAVLAMVSTNESVHWRSYFGFLAVYAGLSGVTTLLSGVAMATGTFGLMWVAAIGQVAIVIDPIWFIVILILDRKTDKRRDWVHWLGVAGVLVHYFGSVAVIGVAYLVSSLL